MTRAEHIIYSSGVQQEVSGHRQQQGRDRLTAEVEYATKSRTHLWLAIVTHKASDNMLDAQDGTTGELALLDVDSMMGPPGVVCYICEEPYEPRLRLRKCPGEPR